MHNKRLSLGLAFLKITMTLAIHSTIFVLGIREWLSIILGSHARSVVSLTSVSLYRLTWTSTLYSSTTLFSPSSVTLSLRPNQTSTFAQAGHLSYADDKAWFKSRSRRVSEAKNPSPYMSHLFLFTVTKARTNQKAQYLRLCGLSIIVRRQVVKSAVKYAMPSKKTLSKNKILHMGSELEAFSHIPTEYDSHWSQFITHHCIKPRSNVHSYF